MKILPSSALRLLLSTLLLSPVLFGTLGCAISFKKSTWDLPPLATEEISVMSFNVENLFDTTHDVDREDYPYLPKAQKDADPKLQAACRQTSNSPYRLGECLNTDWSEKNLDKKLRNLSDVVMDVDGKGPDILMLVEVENENVLNIWNKTYLQRANYQTVVLLEGPDKRGIDVGLMSRFPVVGKPVLHKVPWKGQTPDDQKWMDRSRNILEVNLKVPNGDVLTTFVAHFPSQSNPSYWRRQASEFLTQLILDKGPESMVLAAGDLNITHEEEEKEHFFRDVMGKAGAVSHFAGCKECDGTHNYRGDWSYLDAQIYSKALLADGSGSYKMEPNTIDVIRYNPVHLKKGKYPKRWDNEALEGVSDHFPLYVRLKQRGPAKAVATDKSTASTESPLRGKKSAPKKKK